MVRLSTFCDKFGSHDLTSRDPKCKISPFRATKTLHFNNTGSITPIFGKFIQNFMIKIFKLYVYGKLIQKDNLEDEKCFANFGSRAHWPNMDGFSRYRSESSFSKIEIPTKLDDFSKNRSESPLGKLKFWKNIWMSFLGFTHKG